MDKKNLLFIRLLILGIVGIIIGAELKIAGNPMYYIALYTALSLKLLSIILLIGYNFKKIKAALS